MLRLGLERSRGIGVDEFWISRRQEWRGIVSREVVFLELYAHGRHHGVVFELTAGHMGFSVCHE